MRWFETPSFNFIKGHKFASYVSGALVVVSIAALIVIGLQYGIDFKGGIEFTLHFEEPVEVTEVRSSLSEPLGSVPEVKNFGSERDILIRIDSELPMGQLQDLVLSTLQETYPGNEASVIQSNLVGPSFAEDLRQGALNAVIFGMIIIFLYILIRFKNWTFSTGAVLALMHDVIIVLGVFTLLEDVTDFSLKMDQTIIAALLTIVGYSINDTVVVFDRIRENSILFKTMNFKEMVNKSLNDTLSRTVITSFTTLFVVLVLFIFGGEVLKGFAFALTIGVIIGTYSSLFIASGLMIELEERFRK